MKPWEGYEVEPVRWWFTLRCWLLHWHRHTFEWDSEPPVWVGVRYCLKCRLVVRVLSDED